MKTIRPFRLFAALLVLTVLTVSQSFAQTLPDIPDTATSPAASAMIDTAAAVAQPFIVTFAQNHPWLLTTLALIATLRLVFKPLVSAMEAFVRNSPNTDDDAMFDRVTHSRTFKVVAWLLDYLGSIKVGPQFTAKPGTALPAAK